jgi:hypothetical protein
MNYFSKSFISSFLLLFLSVPFLNTAVAASDYRIISDYRVHVRISPYRYARLTKKLRIGTVIKQIKRSATPEKIRSVLDYWYKIETSDGKKGWIFGKKFSNFNTSERAQSYLQLVKKQLQANLTVSKQMELTDFLFKAQDQIKYPADIAAELALSHLSSLQTAINKLDVNKSYLPPYRRWVERQQQRYLIYFDEVQDTWLINSQTYWDLHDKYYKLAISDQIAWAAVNNGLGGECEGIFECEFQRVYDTSIKYLKFHPTGKYANQALDDIAKFIGSSKTPVRLPQEDFEYLQMQISISQQVIKKTNYQQKQKLLNQITQVAALIKPE